MACSRPLCVLRAKLSSDPDRVRYTNFRRQHLLKCGRQAGLGRRNNPPSNSRELIRRILEFLILADLWL